MTEQRRADADEILAHASFIRGLAIRLTGDVTTADDVTQDAFLAAIESRPESVRSMKGWLARVVRNLVSQANRRDTRRARRERWVAEPERLPSAGELAARRETLRRVVDAIFALREPYQQVIFFRYYDELPPREIARRLGLEVDTVQKRLTRAHAELRARLAEESPSWRGSLLLLAGLDQAKVTVAAKQTAKVLGEIIMTLKAKVALVGSILIAAFSIWWAAELGRLPKQQGPLAEFARPTVAQGPKSARDAALVAEQAAAETAPSERRLESAPVDDERYVGSTGVAGRVIFPDGSPVAGASVVVTTVPIFSEPVESMAFAGHPVFTRESSKLEARALHQTPTDSNGEFEVRGLDGGETHGIIASREADRVIGMAVVSTQQGRIEPVGTIVVDDAASIRGRIIRPDGAPVAGASVRAGWYPRSTAVSGDDGSFAIEVLPPLETDITIEAPGYVVTKPLRIQLVPGETRRLDVGLARATPFRGRVINSHAVGIADARIALVPLAAFGAFETIIAPSAVTSADGAFRFDGIAAGRYEVHCSAAGFLPNVEAIEITSSDQPASRSFVLEGAPAISGIALDTDDAPVVLDLLLIQRSSSRLGSGDEASWRPYPHASVDWSQSSDGHFTIALEDGGRFRVTGVAKGYSPAPSAAFDVEKDGSVEPIVLRFERATLLRVRVIDEATGQPVVGADVGIYASEEGAWRVLRSSGLARDRAVAMAGTDGDGIATFDSLTSIPYTIACYRRGFAGAMVSYELAKSDEPADVDVVLAAGGAIEGNVTTAGGEPIPGAVLEVYRQSGHTLEVIADASGFYRAEHLVPGNYSVSKKAGARSLASSGEVHRMITSTGISINEQNIIVENGRTTRVDVVGEDERRAGAIVGVVEIEGRAANGAQIDLLKTMAAEEDRRRFWESMGHAATDSNGAFWFRRVPCGDYRLSIQVGAGVSYSGGDVVVEDGGESRVEIQIALGSARGRVVDAVTGAPISGAFVTALLAGRVGPEGVCGGRSGEDGRFTFDVLQSGIYEMRASAPGYEMFKMPSVEIVAGRERSGLECRLQPGGGWIHVHLLGEPTAKPIFELLSEGKTILMRPRSRGEDGSYWFGWPKAVEGTLAARIADERSGSQVEGSAPIRHDANGVTEVRITLVAR